VARTHFAAALLPPSHFVTDHFQIAFLYRVRAIALHFSFQRRAFFAANRCHRRYPRCALPHAQVLQLLQRGFDVYGGFSIPSGLGPTVPLGSLRPLGL
jgi:hypothetical protein